MRTSLSVIMLLASSACAPYVKPPTDTHYLRVEPWKSCDDFDPPHATWTSEFGLRFYTTTGATCPDTKDLDTIAHHALQNVGGDIEDIWGARVVFVPTRIWCDDSERLGCTDDVLGDILLTDRPGAWTSFRHEIGHVIRFRRRGDGDGAHKDCEFWRRLEGRGCGVWEAP